MLFSTLTLLIFSLLIHLTTSSPLAVDLLLNSRATTPSPTYPNGTTNPFYPCGTTSAEITACPYRCFTSTGSLLSPCYSQSTATTAINSLQSICVKCEIPDQAEDYPGGCDPLLDYFFSDHRRPSRCGFENHRVRACAYNCNAAQVPFDLCDAQDTTGTYRLCVKCKAQCSSPRVVFQPAYLPSNFSLAEGGCSAQYGPQEVVACPWRCRDAGNPNRYCSLGDKTGNNGFTSCEKC